VIDRVIDRVIDGVSGSPRAGGSPLLNAGP
jgi:hypothetical protein